MAEVEEKISFILYGSYEEQLDMLTNEQAGELMKAIFVYARTGEKDCTDPMAKMMLSVICHQMDIDARKYAEKKERLREAGRKGGIQKAKNMAEASQANNAVANASHATNFVANLAVDEDVDADADADVDVLDNYSGDGGEEEEHAWACEVIHIYENQYRTTQAEVAKCNALADELFVRYAHRQPTEYDRQQVFEHCYSVAPWNEDITIAVFDSEKAALLRYVFQVAANADKVNWSYMEGIYANFRHRGITCMEDVYRDNWEYHYGSISA